MANAFFEPGRQRGAKVNDLFDRIARRYDLINDLQSFGWHRFWKRRLVRLAGVGPGQRALDLCCGTGDVAYALARRGAATVGLDFSGPMLAVAARRNPGGFQPARADASPAGEAENPRATLTFIRGDALHIPFAAASFDVVTISYGLRNLASARDGLREMLRVAKPGGRLLVLDFGKPDHPLWRQIYFGYLRWFVPVLGRVFCGNSAAYAYILESLQHYPAQRGVATLMREFGMIEVRVVNLLGGMMSINYGKAEG